MAGEIADDRCARFLSLPLLKRDPQKINRILASGGIIPSDFYLDLMVPYLSRSNLRDMPLILSAVGRSHGEEPIIMKAAADSGHPIKAVIFLNLSEAEVWARFQDAKIINDRGERADDSSEALKTRLINFRDKTIPVIEFYRDKGLLLEVNGKLSVQEVTDGILQGLLKRSVEKYLICTDDELAFKPSAVML